MSIRVCVWGLLAAALAGCPPKSQSESASTRLVVAQVGDIPIYLDDFRREYHKVRMDRDQGLPAGSSSSTQKRMLLDDLINRRLLVREAEKHNIFVGTDEIEVAFARVRSGWTDADFSAVLGEQDTTAAELKAELRDLLLSRKFLRQNVFSRIAVTDADIEAYVAGNPDVTAETEKVRARQIVVKTEAQAKSVLRELRNGMIFEDAAMKYSQSPDRVSGGDLGFFARGDMPQAFDQVCFELKEGQISAIVPSVYGYHLFQVVERRETRDLTDDEVRERVETLLRSDKEHNARLQKIEELRRASGVTIKEDVLVHVH